MCKIDDVENPDVQDRATPPSPSPALSPGMCVNEKTPTSHALPLTTRTLSRELLRGTGSSGAAKSAEGTESARKKRKKKAPACVDVRNNAVLSIRENQERRA